MNDLSYHNQLNETKFVGTLKNLVMELEQDLLDGDESARGVLFDFGRPQALWGIDKKFDQLAEYLLCDWSIVPQLSGEKQPRVKWKPYQCERPGVCQVFDWFNQWSDAGPAVVLGPVSDLFVVDVDGKEAHDELIRRLGKVPKAPTVLSGSGKPYRYHLFFRCPSIPTRAKATPWHRQLEFRGEGGIVVLPPALHKSGKRYKWARGKSLDDISPPDLPKPIVAAIRDRIRPPQMEPGIGRDEKRVSAWCTASAALHDIS